MDMDTAGQDLLSNQELNNCMSVLLLRNSDQERFREMMVDYRKSFANEDNKYPSSMLDMMDVMRKQPMRKRKPEPLPPKKVEPLAKEETEQCFSQ